MPNSRKRGNNVTIFVTDISEWQKGIDLNIFKPAGIDGVIARVHNGKREDHQFGRHLRQMLANPELICAGYHYCLSPVDASAESQANGIITTLDRHNARWLPIALDAEEIKGIPHATILEIYNRLTTAGIRVFAPYSTQGWWATDPPLPGSKENGAWVANYPGATGYGGSPAEAYARSGGDNGVGWHNTLGGAPAKLWQFTDRATIPGWSRGIDMNAFKGARDELQQFFYGATDKQIAATDLATGTSTELAVREKVLPYSRAQVTQDTGWWCGPASAQTVLQPILDRFIPERQLANEMKTTTAGTWDIQAIAPVLSKYAGVEYAYRHISGNSATEAEREQLWDAITSSINSGYGLVINIVAPPGNYPRGVNGSISPAYSGGTIYHYIAGMGYGGIGEDRRVWIADSGFPPYGYWISLNQLATLIAPKGYAYVKNPKGKTMELQGTSAAALNDTKLAAQQSAKAGAIAVTQLCGAGRDDQGRPTYDGFDVGFVLENAKRKGDASLTLVEAVFLMRAELAETRAQIAELTKKLEAK